MEHVRQARPADATRCVELLSAARAEAEGRRGGAMLIARGADAGAEPRHDVTVTAVIERWTSADDHRLLVGMIDEAAVGLAGGHLAGPATSRIGMLDWCYVEPDARQVGVGSALVTDLLGWFAHQGCVGVDAWALPGDRSTKQLLEAGGLSARLLVLHRRLP